MSRKPFPKNGEVFPNINDKLYIDTLSKLNTANAATRMKLLA